MIGRETYLFYKLLYFSLVLNCISPLCQSYFQREMLSTQIGLGVSCHLPFRGRWAANNCNSTKSWWWFCATFFLGFHLQFAFLDCERWVHLTTSLHYKLQAYQIMMTILCGIFIVGGVMNHVLILHLVNNMYPSWPKMLNCFIVIFQWDGPDEELDQSPSTKICI